MSADAHIRINYWGRALGSDGMVAVEKLHQADRIEIIVPVEARAGEWWDREIVLRRNLFDLDTLERLIRDIQNFGIGMYEHGQRDKAREVRKVLGIASK